MRIRAFAVAVLLPALTGAANAHSGSMAHAHPHPDWSLALLAGAVFVAVAAYGAVKLRSTAKSIKARSRGDDPR